MTAEKPAGPHLAPIVFTVLLLLVIAAAFVHGVMSARGRELVDGATLNQLGKWVGKTGLTLLLLIYGRSALKRLLRLPAPWQRLAALGLDPARVKAGAARTLSLLNRSHPYVGATAVTLIYLHCYAVSNFYKLLPLRIVLGLLAWQGLLGLAAKFPGTPAPLKRKALLLHAQLITGGLLLIFAAIGHYLMLWA